MLGDSDGLIEADSEALTDGLIEGLKLADSDALMLGDSEGLSDADFEALIDGLIEGLKLTDCDMLADGDSLADSDALSLAETEPSSSSVA